MNTSEWLDQVRQMDALIDAKLIERDRLLTLATSVSMNLDGMPHGSGGTSDKVGNAACKLADLARETDELIDKYVDFKREVTRRLEKLPTDEYIVLHKHYIQGLSWGEIARSLSYSREQVWRIKVKGLKSLKHAT